MELSTKFKDLKERRELGGGGKTDTEAEYFPSKMPDLIFVCGVKLLKTTFKHYCESFLCMRGINFHSELSLMLFGTELMFNLKYFATCNTARCRRRADVLDGFILSYVSVRYTIVSCIIGFLLVLVISQSCQEYNNLIQTQMEICKSCGLCGFKYLFPVVHFCCLQSWKTFFKPQLFCFAFESL